MSVSSETPRAGGTVEALARVRAEVRCGDVVGRLREHPKGVCVMPDPFFGGVMPAPSTVVEVEWRLGRQRYAALAPVVSSSHANGVVLGGFRHSYLAGQVQQLDWRLLFVDHKRGELVSEAHRVRYADDDFLRVTAPPTARPEPNEVWSGYVRLGDTRMAVRAQVRGVHVWAGDGTRVVALRWRPVDRAQWNDARGGRQAR